MSFGTPRTDTCETCDEYKNKMKLDENNNSELKDSHKCHLEKANLGFEALKTDTKLAIENSFDLITFDFMQNIACPSLTHSSMFYSRQLWCYCFGISNRVTNKPLFYFWDESNGYHGLLRRFTSFCAAVFCVF